MPGQATDPVLTEEVTPLALIGAAAAAAAPDIFKTTARARAHTWILAGLDSAGFRLYRLLPCQDADRWSCVVSQLRGTLRGTLGRTLPGLAGL